MTVLLETVHGSRLYGTARPDSDYDIYRVVLDGKSRQKITGSVDTINVSLNTFLRQLDLGVPQACEALWSPLKTVKSGWEQYFSSLYPAWSRAVDTHRRTVLGVDSGKPWRRKEYKIKLHQLRLIKQLNDLYSFGSYSPVHSKNDVDLWKEVAGWDDEGYQVFVDGYSILDLKRGI